MVKYVKWVTMQRLDPYTVLPHAHVFNNAEGKGWGHGLIYLPEMLSLLYLVYSTREQLLLQAR